MKSGRTPSQRTPQGSRQQSSTVRRSGGFSIAEGRSPLNEAEGIPSARPHLDSPDPATFPNVDHSSGTESELENPETTHPPQRSASEVTESIVVGAGHHGSSRDAVAKSNKSASGQTQHDLARLKNAVNTKMQHQQREKESDELRDSSHGTTKRVSPIREEDGTVGLGLRSATRSVESTGSQTTVRESTPTTPGSKNPRTSSYPFPSMPTPRDWSSNFHQPFTLLSPTGKIQPKVVENTSRNPKDDQESAASTPVPTTAFLPENVDLYAQEDPRFPTPNLYDMVLQLNAEPGMEQWWVVVSNLMHDHYDVERATLVLPLDPTDIENVPWGQKAAFNMNGLGNPLSHEMTTQSAAQPPRNPQPMPRETSSKIATPDLQLQKVRTEDVRPRLEARHSYAGHNAAKESKRRPRGPVRSMTHTAGKSGNAGFGKASSQRSLQDDDVLRLRSSGRSFSSVSSAADQGPYANIFSGVQPLDHELRPLIDPSGVNRVLERGRVVAITRMYQSDSPEAPSTQFTPSRDQSFKHGKSFEKTSSASAADDNTDTSNDYDDYEVQSTSPWVQSPAPSPAIHTNPDINPFFASEEQQVEESFNPATESPNDYSQSSQIEAIGVDRASTVIHIPLVHPALSPPMQSLRLDPRKKGQRGHLQRSNTVDLERRTPIAILSILCSAVPYPTNLIQSLQLLGPHLATSFAVSQQFSATHTQALHIRHRRTASGGLVSRAPMTIEPQSLEDIVNAELEDPLGLLSSSVTSPSDYSGLSRHSPSGSIVGTPGWDPASFGWNSNRSVAGTTAGANTGMVDNYFEAKKRSQRSTKQTTPPAQATPARSAKMRTSGDGTATTVTELDLKMLRNERRSKTQGAKEKSSDQARAGELAQSNPTESVASQRPSVRHVHNMFSESDLSNPHSTLHSNGADYSSTFGGLTSPKSVTASQSTHMRSLSYSEDMPPPSARLSRKIIDSVPVQIFTALPETGELTWVNSKFLVYRGQEPQQILNDPWQAMHPDDRNEFLPIWQRSLRTNQQLQQKVRLQRFDGEYRWFYVRAAPLKDKLQKVVHWIGTMMDFHEQHIAELNSARQQETEVSERKYRALANSIPQIVFAVSKSKGVLFCNSQWLDFSGQTEAQALGEGFINHVHPDDLSKCKLPTFPDGSNQPQNNAAYVSPEHPSTNSSSVLSSSGSETEKEVLSPPEASSATETQMSQRELSELARTGILKVTCDADGRPSYSTEVRLRSKDGSYRWHLVRIVQAEPLPHHDIEDETWYGTGTDINDHKALERDLKATMDEKSHFLSNMSHEIRTPLNGITGMVNFLIDSNLTAEQMEHVNIIRASTEGLRGLINDILDLSKAEAGMIQLKIDWVYVRALIEEVNDLTSAMAIDKGLELNYLVEEDVPAQFMGDRFRIRQVLLNTVGNAIKFTQIGEVFVRCCIKMDEKNLLAPNEMFVQFEISDTGRGFNDREAEFLFKRFSQIDGSSTRQHSGSGLGLVISKELAQLHGGDMSASSIPNRGSTFTFFIKTTVALDHHNITTPTPAVASNTAVTPAGGMFIPPSQISTLPQTATPAEAQSKPSTRFVAHFTQSPSPHLTSPEPGKMSPAMSSASSDPSTHSAARSSLRSERSSASSFMHDQATTGTSISLQMPTRLSSLSLASEASSPAEVTHRLRQAVSAGETLSPPMFSILIVAPLKYSREATMHHIKETLPKNVPHQITARESFEECQEMLYGDDPVIFTHVVIVLQDVEKITTLMDQILRSTHFSTSIVLITDLAQRRKIMERAPDYDYERLEADRKLRFVFKPLKPSRVGLIFDPQKEREMSLDRNQDSAQQVAITQKQVFDGLLKRLGNKGQRVLLVEDDRINQMVVLKFLAKASIATETVQDGVQCTERVFAKPHGYYSIILCDLHMPNKDGYQTCKEIRKWEKSQNYPHIPIIALSANVLGDVYQNCVAAGFNSYITKPVDFKELSTVLMTFMDPSDPMKPHALMKSFRKQGGLAHPDQ